MASAGRSLALKVFVGNLPWTVGNQELKNFGMKFGPVLTAAVPFDRSTGFNKGYGFINFAHRDAFNAALKSGSHNLEGSMVHIEPTFNLE